MASWFARFLGFIPNEPVLEAKSPPQKEPVPFIEPIGFGNETDAMEKSDRKNAAAVIAAALRTAQERGRAARYTDFDAMDTSDIGAMLDAVVDAVLTFDDVTTRGYKVECDDPKIQEIFDLATERAELQQLAEEILREMLKYGDAFVEPLFVNGELVGAQNYEPREIFVAKDDKNQLASGKDDDGFYAAYQQQRNGRVVAGWQPFELVHFKLYPSRRKLYSTKSLLDGLRADWKKLQLVEQGMVVARVTRAYPRRVHYVDVTGKPRKEQEDTLREYIRRMTRRVAGVKPTDQATGLPVVDVSDDLFITTGYETGPDGKPIPKLNKTEIEDPATAGLAELADVNYMRQKIWSQVPSDVVGIKRNMTQDLDSQDIAYTRLLRRCQRQLEKGLRQIYNQVLLASGRLPSKVTYRITMPTVDIKGSWRYADARFRASMELRNYAEMGAISRRWMMRRAFNLSDLEINKVWDEIAEEATNPIFLPVDVAARNGAPSVGSDNPPTASGNAHKAGNSGDAPEPTGASIVPATGAKIGATTTTKNGISRSSNLSQMGRGNLSGG